MDEMDQKFTLGSGAELEVTVASYQDANALKNAILEAVRGTKGLDDVLGQVTAGGVANADLGPIMDAILGTATSEKVERCLFKCFERCLYNKVKLNLDLFDDRKMGMQVRRDYYEIALKVIQVNCSVFMQGALSLYKGLQIKMPESQA